MALGAIHAGPWESGSTNSLVRGRVLGEKKVECLSERKAQKDWEMKLKGRLGTQFEKKRTQEEENNPVVLTKYRVRKAR